MPFVNLTALKRISFPCIFGERACYGKHQAEAVENIKTPLKTIIHQTNNKQVPYEQKSRFNYGVG